jgi:Outer membrane protein beta-barrel domain
MRRTLTLALALAGAALSAQDITGGLQTGLSLPVGDLKDKSDWGTNQFFGAHIGGHIDFNITSHHQVRGQLTYHNLPGSGWGGPNDFQNDFKILQVGADWVYHFQSPSQGWYTIAGASLNNIKRDSSGVGFSESASQSGKLGVRGGGGYTFNRMFSLEGTVNQVMADKNGNDGLGFDTATWAQVSAVFRFGR